jgi:hypothetical protein
MFDFLKGSKHGKLNKNVLRKNDISLLILDERWNSLFNSSEKSSDILASEERLRNLLKEQSRLIAESKEISASKKRCMDKIMKLTPEVFDNNNPAAKEEMLECEKEIKRINERIGVLEKEIDNIPDRIKDENLVLLEITTKQIYYKMRVDQRRENELEKKIADINLKIREYAEERERLTGEKETLTKDETSTYSYFHDLLGGEELERLDKEFFGDKK